MGWDTKVTGLPVGGYVINQESSKLNKSALEAMKFDNSKYPTTPAEVGNNEFVFTPKEVDMYGIDKMNEINNSAKEAAHSSIDNLMAMNTLSQIPSMAGGGNIGNPMLPNYQNGGNVLRSELEAPVTDEDWAFMNIKDPFHSVEPEDGVGFRSPMLYPNIPGSVISEYVDPKVVFGENYKDMSPKELNQAAEEFRATVSEFKSEAQHGGREDRYSEDLGFGRPADRKQDIGALEDFIYMLKYGQAGNKAVDRIMNAIQRVPNEDPMDNLMWGLKGSLFKDFEYPEQTNGKYDTPFRPQGYQRGGGVSDATATSAMDELLAQAMISDALKKKPQSKYSMVDADKVDAQNQEMLDMITSMALPGGFGGALGAIGKIKPMKLAKHATRIMENRPKPQRVLDKIASTMKVAPKSGKPFNSKELINKGYLQKYINNLVKARAPMGKDTQIGDIVDANFPKGYMNINEVKEAATKVPKKFREQELKDLLDRFSGKIDPIVGSYQTGGGIDFNQPFDMSILEGEQSDYADSLGSEMKRREEYQKMIQEMFGKEISKDISMGKDPRGYNLELTKEQDAYNNNPNKGHGITILDDLLRNWWNHHKYGGNPMGKQ